jgi:hypothetical protein
VKISSTRLAFTALFAVGGGFLGCVGAISGVTSAALLGGFFIGMAAFSVLLALDDDA